MGIALRCTSTMYRSGGWRTAIEIRVVSRSCVYKGQRTPPTVDWHATTYILEYHTFVGFGASSPSRAVFPSASGRSRFTTSDLTPDPVPVRSSDSDLPVRMRDYDLRSGSGSGPRPRSSRQRFSLLFASLPRRVAL